MSMALYILNMTMTVFVAFLLMLVVSIFPITTEAATTFIGSTIEGVDEAHQTITIRTREGQSWTLPVDGPDLLKKEHIAKGDQVSIEVDPKNDKVIKILRLAEQTPVEQHRSEPVEPTP